MVLHGQPVRASLRISPEFTLIKGSSPGFGSIAFCLLTQCKLCEQRAIHTRFPYPFGLYALKEAKDNKSLAHSSIGTPSHHATCVASVPILCKHMVSGTISSPSPGYFSTFPHGTGSLSMMRGI